MTTAERSSELQRVVNAARRVREEWEFDIENLCSDPLPSTAVLQTLSRHIKFGEPVGHFLTAILTNDLCEAVGRADEVNRQALPFLVMFLYNRAPSYCWRTAEKVAMWREAHAIIDSGEP